MTTSVHVEYGNICIINNINGTSSSIKAILVDENGHLAANEAEVDKVEGFTAFGDPLIIRNNT